MGPAERMLFLYLLVLLPVTYWAGRLFGYRAARKLLACFTPLGSTRPGNPHPDQMARAGMMTRLVAAAAERSFSSIPCWARALVLYRLLHRQGIRGDLCFGAMREGKNLKAHAWVELGGRVFDASGQQGEFYAARLRKAADSSCSIR
jgi:hypothetical protein